MFQVLQTLTFAWYISTETFPTRISARQRSDVTVRLFENDTRVMNAQNSEYTRRGCLEILALNGLVFEVFLQVSKVV